MHKQNFTNDEVLLVVKNVDTQTDRCVSLSLRPNIKIYERRETLNVTTIRQRKRIATILVF